jgi:drug/metabolite transporter (DMT)-like permease
MGPMIVSRSLSEVPPYGVLSVALGINAVVYLPFAIRQAPATTPSAGVLWSLVGLGVLCTATAFLVFFALIAEVGPQRATVITYLNPAVAVLLGVTLRGESFTTGMAVGFPLVLLGCWLATGRRQPAEPESVSELESAVQPADSAGLESPEPTYSGPPRAGVAARPDKELL